MRYRAFAWWWVCACLLLACGDTSGGNADETGPVTGQQPAAGASGQSASGTGGGTPAMPMSGGTSAGSAGRAGSAGMPPPAAGMGSMAGEGGTAGTDADAGASGVGGSAGGTSGVGGSAGSAGEGPDPEGPDPTTESASRAGPLNVESIPWTEFRNGPDFAGGTIWYPTDGEPPYPFVAIVPGFTAYESSIRSWGPFLASHNIVAITIDTNTTADQPPTRAAALLDALESVAAENSRSGSPLMDKLDESRQALMGWSMGGGGTLIAANRTPSLKAAISLCGWNPLGSYSMMTVPSLMFASLGDPLAGGQSQGFYRSIPDTTPKMLIEAGVADHFVANNPAYLNGLIGRYGLSWLKVFMVGDERYRQFLLEMPQGTTDYASNVE
jgi:dienelactone hydrolase